MFRFDAAFRAEFRENWLVLLVAFSCFLFGFSAPAYALPFIFPEVIDHLGWTREQATLLASSKYAVGIVCALLVGRFVDRTGAWLSLLVTVSMGGLALTSFLWISTLTSYYLVGILLGFASGGTMVALKVLISRSFHNSQGTAMGLVLMGSVLGSVVLPFAITAADAALGWRGGIAAMSAGIWLVAVPMLLYGLFSPHMAFGRRTIAVPLDKAAAPGPANQPLREIMREPRFWMIGIAVMTVGMIDQAFTQHQVLIFKDVGLSPEWTAAAVSGIGVMGIVTRLFVGNMLDATSNRGLAILWWVLSLSILMAFALGNPIVLVAFIVLRATGHSAVMLDTTIMTKHVYGPGQIGTLIGIYTAMVSAGFALGPWLMGRMYDMSGSYASSYILFAILPILASLLIWPIKPVFWLELKARNAAARAAEPAAAQGSAA